MKFTYRVREDLAAHGEEPENIVYGIDVIEEHDGEQKLIRSVKDIFCEREHAEQLTELCTRLELDPMQLDDVIEDELAQV